MTDASPRRRTTFALVLALTIAAAMLMVSEVSYLLSVRSMDAVRGNLSVHDDVQKLAHLLVDAETGQRGYLLTGRPSYLDPYVDSLKSLESLRETLTVALAKSPLNGDRMLRINQLIASRLDEMSQTIRLRAAHDEPGWQAILLTDRGKNEMDEIRLLTDTIADGEWANIMRGREGVRTLLLINRVGVSIVTVMALVTLLLFYNSVRALTRQRALQQAAVQAERDHLESEVQRRTEQLTGLTEHLQTVREDERARLARELHDELGALLTAAKLDAARLKSRLGPTSAEVTGRLEHLNQMLVESVALKRRIIGDLYPPALSALGLSAALEALLDEFATGTGLALEHHVEPVQLSPSGQLTVYRLVQEALNNVARHARARKVFVSLSLHEGIVEVDVRDDGVGFSQPNASGSTHGLLGMKYRVEAQGGQLSVAGEQGEGTVVHATIPREPPPQSLAALTARA